MLLNIELCCKCFPVTFAKFSRTIIFIVHLRMTTSVSSDKNHQLVIKQVLRKTKGAIGHTILALFCSYYAVLLALFIFI